MMVPEELTTVEGVDILIAFRNSLDANLREGYLLNANLPNSLTTDECGQRSLQGAARRGG